jgi:methionine biosynthesis protein MetW
MSSHPDASVESLIGAEANPLRYGRVVEWPLESPQVIRALMPRDADVLDVGVGIGDLTEFTNRGKGNTVLCIEPDPDRAAEAVSKGLNVHSGFLDGDFVARQQRFDAILFADVLEHMVDPAQALDLAKRCLKPGGVIIASVPNVAHWSVRLSLLFGRFDYADTGIMDATHLRWFTRKTLRKLFSNQGFKILEEKRTAGFILAAYRPARILPSPIRLIVLSPFLRLFPGLFACQFVIKAQIA